MTVLYTRTAVRNDGYYPETLVYCPYCNNMKSFYSISPAICSHCNNSLPDVRQMNLIMEYRLLWYKGEKDDKNISA